MDQWVTQFYGSNGPIWSWGINSNTSPLIKQLIQICSEMVSRMGSIENASMRLNGWFSGTDGMSKAYNFFVSNMGLWPWKPLIWKLCILPKHRFIIWLFAHGKFLTKDRKSYILEKQCALYGGEEENMAHLFFKCEISRGIWLNIRNWLQMDKLMGSPNMVIRAFRGAYRGNSNLAKARTSAVAASIYHIWNARNRAIFEGEKANIEVIPRKIKIVVLRCIPIETHNALY